MWERKQKNQFGNVQNYTSSEQPWFKATEKKVIDSAPHVTYTVEYLRKELEEAEEKSQLRGSKINPWELYDEYKTDSLGLAIHEVLLRMFDDSIDFKMWMNVDETEVFADIPNTTWHTVRELVQKGISNKMDAMQQQLDEQDKAIKDFAIFLSDMNASEVYKRWKRERSDS